MRNIIIFILFTIFFCTTASAIVGVDWTQRSVPYHMDLAGVAIGNDIIIAVSDSGDGNNSILWSDDGIDYTNVSSANDSCSLRDVIYDENYTRFVAVGPDGAMYSNSNGTSWTMADLPTNVTWNAIAYGNNTCTVVGYGGAGHRMAYSINGGANWTMFEPYPTYDTHTWYDVDYNDYDKYFYVVSQDSQITMGTPGVITWSSYTFAGGAANDYEFTSIKSNGNYLVAVADVSDDAGEYAVYGRSGGWTDSELPVNSWQGVTYGNGEWIAIEAGNTVALSTDGLTWTTDTIPSEIWWDIAYGVDSFTGGKIFVAVANTAGTDLVLTSGGWVPTLLNPTNASTVNATYPPLFTDITLSWEALSGVDGYNYQVATDSGFSTLVYDATTTSNYTTQEFEGDTYYWRVSAYSSVLGNSSYSDVWQFTVNQTSSSLGTAVHGVIYNTENNPILNAKVTLYNDTYSDDYTTASNGYYRFDELTNGTYYITASKDGYETSTTNIITLATNVTTTHNIMLEKESAPNYIVPHYVQFIVTDISMTRYDGAVVTVYEGDSATAFDTDTTGDDGCAGFELSETVRYRVVCVYEGQTQTFYVTPHDDKYYIYLDTDLIPDIDRKQIEEITVTVTPSAINDSHANVNVNYVDNASATTSLFLYINDSSGNVASSGDITPDHEYNFTLTDYQGEDYYVVVVAEHSTFGTVVRQYAIHFANTSLDIGIWGTWIAVIAVVMIAMSASKENASKAAGGMLVLVAVFMAIGWLPTTTQYTTMYAITFFFVIAWHFKNKDRSVAE